MSLLNILLLFVGIPLLLTALIVVLVYAPSTARGPRYRPGLSWWAEPEWFDGPQEGLRALDTSQQPVAEVGAGSGGSTAYAYGSRPEPQSLSSGGASASW
jgi:hypothetical protein